MDDARRRSPWPRAVATGVPHATCTEPAVHAPRALLEAEWQARVQLAAAYRIFDHLGWTELIYNHISLRVPGETDIS